MQSVIEKAACQIRIAKEQNSPCSPIRHFFEEKNIDAAYNIQEINTEQRIKNGHRIVGQKIGLTSLAVQQQLGVSEPDFGMLFDDMGFLSESEIPYELLIQAKAETELGFVLKDNLTEKTIDIETIKNAIDYVVVAIEIVGSRIENWDINIMDTIADNASASHYIVGENRIPLHHIDLENCKMQMFKNNELASEGTGKACMGNPLIAVKWLAEKMAKLNKPLSKGQLILSGALGPMVNITKGDHVVARIDDLDKVEFKVV
jgi:2-keto-4-pentenoate hydratase